jgi:hypothetical protein
VSPEGSSLIFLLIGSGIKDLQIIEELDPELISQGSKVLVSFCNDVGEYTDGDFWYVVLCGDDVLIVVVYVVLVFQGKDFIVGLGMVGGVMAAVVGRSFLLLVAFFLLLLRVCWIMLVTLLVVLTILVVSAVAILVVVAVMVVVLIIVMGVVGIYSLWIARVTTFGI